jgi:hypothetical protein
MHFPVSPLQRDESLAPMRLGPTGLWTVLEDLIIQQWAISVHGLGATPKELSGWNILLFPLFLRDVTFGPSIWVDFAMQPEGKLQTAKESFGRPELLAEYIVKIAEKR